MTGGFERGLTLLDQIHLPGYHLLPATRADFLRRLGRLKEAATACREALVLAAMTPSAGSSNGPLQGLTQDR